MLLNYIGCEFQAADDHKMRGTPNEHVTELLDYAKNAAQDDFHVFHRFFYRPRHIFLYCGGQGFVEFNGRHQSVGGALD